MQHEKVFAVVVTVPGGPDATADALKVAVQELITKAKRYPPDRRFDWGAAMLEDM